MFNLVGSVNSRWKCFRTYFSLFCILKLTSSFSSSSTVLKSSSEHEILSSGVPLSPKTYCISSKCDRLQLKFQAWNQSFEVNLRQNENLLNDKSNPSLNSSCHYLGTFKRSDSHIDGEQSSNWAALSVCNGVINGLLVGSNEFYHLHHVKETRQNLIFKNTQVFIDCKQEECGTESATTRENVNLNQNTEGDSNGDNCDEEESKVGANRVKRSIVKGYSQVDSQTKFVELILVNDHRLYQQTYKADEKALIQDNLIVANLVNALYRQLNVKIILVDIVIWKNGDEIQFHPLSNVTLNNFLSYRQNVLIPTRPHDNAQLISAVKFEGEVVGKAIKGSICDTKNSGGINHFHSRVLSFVATTIAHEMGHNFGMEHDRDDCYCPSRACIMAQTVSDILPTAWSACSKSVLFHPDTNINYDCLKNEPRVNPYAAVCGNGVLEEGEECDCDTPACQNCCHSETCKLKANAVCGSGICCDLSNCLPANDMRVCRVSSSECDIVERCDGLSEFCPIDAILHNGFECPGGFCYNGECNTLEKQCQTLWGPGAQVAPEVCFDVNKKGTEHGNCGLESSGYFKKCETKEDRQCGLLHCLSPREFPVYGGDYVSVRTFTTTLMVNLRRLVCRSANIVNHPDQASITYVKSGVACGANKTCLNNKCVLINELIKVNECPEDCHKGHCDNNGFCHDENGFLLPMNPTVSFWKIIFTILQIIFIVSIAVAAAYFIYKGYFIIIWPKLNQTSVTSRNSQRPTSTSGQPSISGAAPALALTSSTPAQRSTMAVTRGNSTITSPRGPDYGQKKPVRTAPPVPVRPAPPVPKAAAKAPAVIPHQAINVPDSNRNHVTRMIPTLNAHTQSHPLQNGQSQGRQNGFVQKNQKGSKTGHLDENSNFNEKVKFFSQPKT